MGIVAKVAQLGNQGEGEHLKKSGKREEEGTAGVIKELDQNRDGPVGMCVENKKHGLWKRKARATQAKSNKENGMGKEYNKEGLGNKRSFELKGEDDIVAGEAQNGKKIKIEEKSWQMIKNQVEIASHKWP